MQDKPQTTYMPVKTQREIIAMTGSDGVELIVLNMEVTISRTAPFPYLECKLCGSKFVTHGWLKKHEDKCK